MLKKIIKKNIQKMLLSILLLPLPALAAKGLLGELEDAKIKAGLKNISLEETTGKIIGGLLGFVGIIFLSLIIYGGYLWMTAGGNEEQVGKAKKIIKTSVTGLLIVVFSYAITGFVIELIIAATS